VLGALTIGGGSAQAGHNGAKLELRGLWGALIGPKTVLLIPYVFTAILSLMKHVKTFNVRYLPKEAFFKTILLNNVYLK
jgi:hypothetical protein